MSTKWAPKVRGGALAVAVAALIVVSASPVAAHSYLADSTPAAGSTITELPGVFSVTTNEQLLDLTGNADGFALQVIDASGLYYGDGCLSVAGATLTAGASLGPSGDYTLIWQVVSEDGHPVSGEFGFSWRPTDAAQSTTGSTTPPVCGAAEPTPAASTTTPAEPEPANTSAPIATAEQGDADLKSVLLVGGIIAALLGAAALSVLLLGFGSRRKPS